MVAGGAAPNLVGPLAPLLNGIIGTFQGFFATPQGVSVAESFLERNTKVVLCTFLFGDTVNKFLLVFNEKEKRRRLIALGWCGLSGVSIFLILNDHKYTSFFVQGLIQTFPAIQRLAERPFGRIFLLFGSGVLVQSAGFPRIVTICYGWLLYISGLYHYIISVNVPFMPRK